VTPELARDKLIVVTGLAGSGKSSLAFDTIYAEGPRRLVRAVVGACPRRFGSGDNLDSPTDAGVKATVDELDADDRHPLYMIPEPYTRRTFT